MKKKMNQLKYLKKVLITDDMCMEIDQVKTDFETVIYISNIVYLFFITYNR